MQEWFCLQLRCARVSAETEQGDKGTGRPISRAVLLPCPPPLPPLTPTPPPPLRLHWFNSASQTSGCCNEPLCPGTAAKSREKGTEPGHNLAGARKRGGGGSRGEFLVFFSFSPGWMGDGGDGSFVLPFCFENYCLCAAPGQEVKPRRLKIPESRHPARCRDPRSGAAGRKPCRGRREHRSAHRSAAAAGTGAAWGLGYSSRQGSAGPLGVQF